MADDDADFLHNPANWPDVDAAPREWVECSLRLLRVEIACALDHVAIPDEENDYKLAKHLEDLGEGIRVTIETFVRRVASEDLLTELSRQTLEQQFGVPVHSHAIPGFGHIFTAEPVDIPDSPDDIHYE